MKNKSNIILASSSKRRLKLLSQIGINPEKVLKPNIDEKSFSSLPISKRVKELAFQKAISVKNSAKHNYLISADTVVYRAGISFEKSCKISDVKSYLKKLSGRKHIVYGGVCVISPQGIISKRVVKTEVFMKNITENELEDKNILNYGLGKAGGYAIQGFGEMMIYKIKGSFSNVMGLSIYDVHSMLIGLGWKKN